MAPHASAGRHRSARPVPGRPGKGRDLSIELRGFGWRHAGRRAWALRDLNLQLGPGERVLLVGPSGSGKSTLLASLAGLLDPLEAGEQEGELLIDGLPAQHARGRVGLVFQDPQSQLVMARAGDDVAFGLENAGVPRAEIWPRVSKALADVGFPYPLDRSTSALSGGEQQRLALAGALVREPSVLLLDEPTSNLDPAGAALVRSALSLVSGPTVVLVEHRVASVLPLVDRVIALSPEGLLADGAPDEVFARHGSRLAALGIWVPSAPLPRPPSPPPGPVVLRAADVSYVYGPARVSLLARAGEALAILGANGSGKSTLALLLGGLLAPTTGRVTYQGCPTPPHRWKAPALARRIGSVFQQPEHQFVTGRVIDELRRPGTSPSTVSDLLERLRLSHLASANPHTLSGGEQRRLSVATALVTAPEVLVLDEPTYGQDRRTWTELVSLLAELRSDGRAIVAVTHDESFVAALADRTQYL